MVLNAEATRAADACGRGDAPRVRAEPRVGREWGVGLLRGGGRARRLVGRAEAARTADT